MFESVTEPSPVAARACWPARMPASRVAMTRMARFMPSAHRETGVWGLVVGGVLPGDRLAVLPVLHQGNVRDAGRVGGGEDPQGPVVRCRPDDLLAPVAEDVRGQGRRGLGAIVGMHAGRGQQPGVAAGAVLVDVRAVQQL